MQVRSKALQLISRYVADADRETFDLDSRIEQLELDSLAMFEIVYELEEAFAVELDEEELARVKTVRNLVEGVERKLSGEN